MVRNIVVLGGNSHPKLVESICNILGIQACDRNLSKFSVGESRCEIQDSVRGKDVFIIQTASGKVNDNFIDLCIMISACKTGSARRITVVMPLFPYSRQPDVPYAKTGAPLASSRTHGKSDYTFESVPGTPHPNVNKTASFNSSTDITEQLASSSLSTPSGTTHPDANGYISKELQVNPGYKQWIAQPGALIADLLTCAGADHILTMDLHDSQFQGFFDKPVDNLYGRPLLKRYITQYIDNYQDAVIVSPDAGGAKRATAIADSLLMDFALIHKERKPIRINDKHNATMMLVGKVKGKVCIMIDDLADTANTITRAARVLKREGAVAVYSLLTHGIFSGDALQRLAQSDVDKVVVTNTVPQDEHKAILGAKLDVLDIAPSFAEACRRIHFGESLNVLF
ncbi:Ribose-phosphate pyrophosphokinase 5 [Ceratocystis fimbriata CBS 114723]|uniref:ribose-phosphate diphosphokinase n=1 Tax=Ceratocystis fimbriata CBS 114723 TaxID=1035309 RepID=A0A2C5XDX5_9PEZI|nr:Ribose-phosphate pyrophosphokinase 5 [Ceratocystis fimbriata CBS 114723]